MKTMLTRSVLIVIVALGGTMWTGATEAHAADGPICYVGSGATETPDGNSWASAWPHLQTALFYDICKEIWVKAGVYHPGSLDTHFFIVQEGTAVYGGFAGSETLRTQRNPDENITVLSGDIDDDDVNTDGNQIDESVADIVGTNSQRVLGLWNSPGPITLATVLDGFVITGGNGSQGAGLSCTHLDSCSPTLSNLVFSGNRASDSGGAMYVLGSATYTANPILTGVQFIGNQAALGGAIYIRNANPTFVGATFRDNTAGGGGAVHIQADTGRTSAPSFKAAMFIDNTSDHTGGAVANLANGGQTSPAFEMVSFVNNHTSGIGGAVENLGNLGGQTEPTFLNVTFQGNSAYSGGAMFSRGGAAGDVGSPHLLNVTFSGNTASTDGGALYNDAMAGATVSPTLTNAILWGDSAAGLGDEVYNKAGNPTYTYSLIQGALPGGMWDTSIGTNGGNNLDVDPLLDPIHDDWVMPLLWGSPAIDAGQPGTCPPTDQREINRPQGAGCDMGAYERIAPLSLDDFDADVTSDIGVFRPSTNGWFVKDHLATVYGLAGDIPIPGYYKTGSRTALPAVFRPSTAGWYVQSLYSTIYGLPGDIPVPADYNGDGTWELAVYRPATSAWYIKNMSATIYGLPGDIPIPGDYDGDGLADIAVYRPSTRGWFIKGVTAAVYGLADDIPVPADYDGKGTMEIAVYRPSTRGWFIRGKDATIYGLSGDVPVPADYNGDGAAEVAVYRPSTSGWYVKDVLATIYGLVGDYPLPAPDTNADGDPYQ